MRSQRQPAPAELTGAVTTRARCCDFPENAGTASASGERCRGLLPGGGRWAEASANEGAPLAAASLPGAACPWSLGGGGRGTGHAPCTHLTLLGALRVWEPQHTARRPGLHPGPPRPTRPWAAHSSGARGLRLSSLRLPSALSAAGAAPRPSGRPRSRASRATELDRSPVLRSQLGPHPLLPGGRGPGWWPLPARCQVQTQRRDREASGGSWTEGPEIQDHAGLPEPLPGSAGTSCRPTVLSAVNRSRGHFLQPQGATRLLGVGVVGGPGVQWGAGGRFRVDDGACVLGGASDADPASSSPSALGWASGAELPVTLSVGGT